MDHAATEARWRQRSAVLRSRGRFDSCRWLRTDEILCRVSIAAAELAEHHRHSTGAAQRSESSLQRTGPELHGDVRVDGDQRRGERRRANCRSEASGEVDRGNCRLLKPRTSARSELLRQDRQTPSHRPRCIRDRRQGRHRVGHRRWTGPTQSTAQRGLRF